MAKSAFASVSCSLSRGSADMLTIFFFYPTRLKRRWTALDPKRQNGAS